eukprot:TRINITY_DN3721_c0_g1_i2.p1 TRINITY_DN3721_c0_g1~~TRINITY_DN3721_c0_g1_i2.p1  ORF type:complete len:451 (-),score=56.94 TRINITY_DN3721_c0_g1_i2:125-1477(-)
MKHPKAFWFVSTAPYSNNRKVLDNEQYKDWHPPIPELLQKTPSEDILHTPIMNINLPAKNWIAPEARVVLLGDAAHAVPPNLAAGGMSALLDSVQLASSLSKLWNHSQIGLDSASLKLALEEYVSIRKAPVRRIQKCSWLIAQMGQLRSPVLCQLRDRLIPFMGTRRLRDAVFTRLHRWYLGWDYTVPDLKTGLYPRLMPKSIWEDMPQVLQHFHSATPGTDQVITHECRGVANVGRDSSLIGYVAAKLAGFPPAIAQAEVTVQTHVNSKDGSELWDRTFTDVESGQNYKFVSHQRCEEGKLVESTRLDPFGLAQMEFVFDVDPIIKKNDDNDNHEKNNNRSSRIVGFEHKLVKTRVRVLPNLLWNNPLSLAASGPTDSRSQGLLSFGIPEFLCPGLSATTEVTNPDDVMWNFKVHVFAPKIFGHKSLCSYQGQIKSFDKPEILLAKPAR